MNTFFDLIPLPSSISIMDGFFSFDIEPVTLEISTDFFNEHVQLVCAQLTSAGLPCKRATKTSALPRIAIEHDTALSMNETYQMRITPKNIQIRASDAAGAFYAFQTLRQLAMTACKTDKTKNTVSIPCLSIVDTPAYSWRGFMIDTSRSFYPVEFLKKMIDAAALHKLNRFHWHLTDDQGWRLPVKEYPLLTEIGSLRKDLHVPHHPKTGGFYTEQEIKDLVKYASQHCVTIVPEIETPGHFSAVLASYPGLGCTGGPYAVEDRYGIFEDVLCAGNDEVFIFLEKVFDTVCRLFPGPYVHIGGDECPSSRWENCPKCQERMKKEGFTRASQLQGWLTTKIAAMLEKRAKIPIAWDEVLDGTEKSGLPQSLIVQSWRGIRGGIAASRRGHAVIMSPQTEGCYFDFKNQNNPLEPGRRSSASVKQVYNFSPLPKKLLGDGDEGLIQNFIGAQANLWTEGLYAPKIAEYMLFPRLCALAENLWLTPLQKNFKSFSKRLSVHKNRLDALDILYYKGPLQ